MLCILASHEGTVYRGTNFGCGTIVQTQEKIDGGPNSFSNNYPERRCLYNWQFNYIQFKPCLFPKVICGHIPLIQKIRLNLYSWCPITGGIHPILEAKGRVHIYVYKTGNN